MHFGKIYDIERISGKVAFSNINARDLITLKRSIENLPEIKRILAETKSRMNKEIYNSLDTLEDIYTLIDSTILEDPVQTITERWYDKIRSI